MIRASYEGINSWANDKQLLRASRNIAVKEQLAMSLSTLGQGPSDRAVQERV
jgi:hypothetical protein